MKHIFAVILSALFLLTLCACDSQPEPTETTQLPETTLPEEPTETTVPEVPEAAFDDYVFLYENQRDLDWEEDIVYFARLFLGEHVVKGHPYLTARLISIIDLDNSVSQRYFYDAALRDTFVAEIHDLIAAVPDLNDNQIAHELMRIAALLGDAHTQVYMPAAAYFPLVVEQMEQGGELGLYATRIHEEYGDLVLSELVSINGIPVDEVMERLSVYVSTENEHWANNCITSIFNNMHIVELGALQAAGVVAHDADTAVFGFLTENGSTKEVQLTALNLAAGEYWSVPYVDCTQFGMGFLSYSRYGETSYFHQYLELYDSMYIRLYDCSADAEYRLEDLLEEVDQELRVIGAVDKIIVDVRDNPGGYVHFVDGLIDFLREANAEEIYILVDNGSFSAGTIFPSRARTKLDNVTIVGTHTAQTPNFFAGPTSLNLRKHEVYFAVSTNYFEGDPTFVGKALAPDILVYQNLEDYRMRIDTALQTVLDRP